MLGEMPPGPAFGFSTRRDAAMTASSTVGKESSNEATETIPASQARASNAGSCRLISTTPWG